VHKKSGLVCQLSHDLLCFIDFHFSSNEFITGMREDYVVYYHYLILFQAELWERGIANAVQTVNFSQPGAHLITFNTRQLLDIVAAAPLPGGLGVNTQINLDRVRVAIRR
jgi:hypothetical protein